MNVKRMFIPSQVGMRMSARLSQRITKERGKSPPTVRTRINYDDDQRRYCRTRLEKSNRSRSPQPVPTPRPPKSKYCRLGYWMEDLGYLIRDMPITAIKMPGTHDSATYGITPQSRAASGQAAAKLSTVTGDPRQWTVTQTKTILEQLICGCRFLDIRVSYEEKEGRFFMHHGLLANSLPNGLNMIKHFFETHPYEFVIVKIKPTSTTEDFLENMMMVIHKILGNQHIVQKTIFLSGVDPKTGKKIVSGTKDRLPNELRLRDCEGKIMVIIDDRSFEEGSLKVSAAKFLYGSSVLYSKWPNKRDFNELRQAVIDTQPDKTNTQLYCLHFTFTANAQYIVSHMSASKPVHDLYTLTKKLEEQKDEVTGAQDNWHYIISLLRAKTGTKRDININVVDFLNGMKSYRVIFLNYPKSQIPPLPPQLEPNHNVPSQLPKAASSKDAEPKKKHHFFFGKKEKKPK